MIFSSSPQRSASTSLASSTPISRPVRAQNAIIRVSEPSSSRMFDLMRPAMRNATSSSRRTRSSAAFLRRIATRVSKSGGWMSAMRPFEARAEAFFDLGNILRRAIARDDDLLSRLVQIVERVEELFLRPLLPRDELDIVDQQEIDVAIARAELGRPIVANRIDQLIGESLRRQIRDGHRRKQAARLMADRVE